LALGRVPLTLGGAEVSMTEAEWLVSTKMSPMLDYLKGKASDRRWILFSCGCVRRIWRLVSDQRCRSRVEVAERFVDGLASGEELNRAAEAIEGADDLEDEAGNHTFQAVESIGYTGPLAALTVVSKASDSACFAAATSPGKWSAEAWEAAEATEHRVQMALLRDIFGNPFHPVAFDSAWRTPNVVALATAAYEERLMPSGELDPHRLSILADALEEVGAAEEVVAHLRSDGPHVRGCWAVDLCLGKG
jgi:hypothetical protein